MHLGYEMSEFFSLSSNTSAHGSVLTGTLCGSDHLKVSLEFPFFQELVPKSG